MQSYDQDDLLWVTFDKEDARYFLGDGNFIGGYHPTQRSLLNFVRNFRLAWKIFKKYRVKAIISTGAGIAVPFFILGNLHGVKSLYVESISRSTDLSLSGKLVYFFCDHFFVQWEELQGKYRKTEFQGHLL